MEDELKTPYLDQYTDNLSAKVAKQAADYQVYGRDKEVQAVIISLLRRTKNNPILVGEAGVGKTAIVEGLTLAILRNKVPDAIIFSLSMNFIPSLGQVVKTAKHLMQEM